MICASRWLHRGRRFNQNYMLSLVRAPENQIRPMSRRPDGVLHVPGQDAGKAVNVLNLPKIAKIV